jgi:hypothetical protein
MKNARLEALVWTLIYGGLLVLCLGLFLLRASAGFAWTLIVIGGLVAAVGATLIIVRSRRPDDR